MALVRDLGNAGVPTVHPTKSAIPSNQFDPQLANTVLSRESGGEQVSSRTVKARVTPWRGFLRATAYACAVAGLFGCEVDSYLDPSRTGYFETTPTTMPVLTRLDPIDQSSVRRSKVSAPTAEDLVPGELKYRLAPGDVVRIEIFELIAPGETEVFERVIDQTGNIPIKQLGDVVAAGLTVEEFQHEIEGKAARIIQNPLVSVSLERGQGFQFSISGSVQSTGVFALTRPDFRLSEAIALAGGTLATTQRVTVIRAAPLDDTLNPIYPEPQAGKPAQQGGGASGGEGNGVAKPSVDIDELINQLGGEKPAENRPAAGSGATAPAGVDTTGSSTAPAQPTATPAGTAPGMIGDTRKPLGQDDAPAVDVDDLATPKVGETPAAEKPTQAPSTGWTFDAATNRWVRGTGTAGAKATRPTRATGSQEEESMYATRIIEVDYQSLVKGDPNLNVVIRPGDQIYVEPPQTGLLYIDGEINRIGVYQLENTNGRLTLSRFVSAAGGLAPTAIPNRVDLIRVVGKDREATIRVDLQAIRNRAEPDIYMQPDDHVIIGTNFFALPLAVIRNGFRMTYGFGFLLDRNFGNDVFGPPPADTPFF
jgi:polysaccharide export outer membrane protein